MDAKYIKGMLNHPTLHPNDAINRWIATILLFNFKLVHIPAEKHTGANGLSHCPHAGEDPLLDDSNEIKDWINSNARFFIEVYSSPLPYDSAPPPVNAPRYCEHAECLFHDSFNHSYPPSQDPLHIYGSALRSKVNPHQTIFVHT